MNSYVYVFDLYTKNLEIRSESFTLLIDYATKQYEATIYLCSKIDGLNINKTQYTTKIEQQQSNCRVYMLIDTQLDVNTLDSIHNTLKNKYNFIYKPTTFFQVQVIKKFNRLNDVKNVLDSFILANLEYTDIFKRYFEVNKIPGTFEYENKIQKLLPPSQSSIVDDDRYEFGLMSKNSEYIHYINFEKKHDQDIIPDYIILLSNDKQLLCCKNIIPQTLIDMVVYLIPENKDYIYYSIHARLGYFEYKFENNYYYIWLSSKNLIQCRNSDGMNKTLECRFNTFKFDDQRILLRMFKTFINKFNISDYKIVDNSTIYYNDDDILLFIGIFPEYLDRIHFNNFELVSCIS